MKEKQNWSSERPKLVNARKLRGIHFIDREDMELAEIIKTAQKNWKCRPLLLCRGKWATGRNGVTCIQKDDHKSRLTCTLQADKTKRLRT